MKKASIEIRPAIRKPEKVNPYLFGHFVEDIRDHMEAMLDFPLRGMDFEDPAQGGVSSAWKPYTNGKSTVYATEPAAPKHAGQSQKIRLYSADQCYAGITQPVSVRKATKYRLKVYARASIEIKQLHVQIIERVTEQILTETVIPLISHNWKEYEAELEIHEACDNAEFRVWISSEGATWRDSVATGLLWLDHTSLLPADSVGFVRKEVVEMTKELRAGMMRLAGNYISAYHWEHGVGPVYERPIMYNEAWGGWANKYFGTNEFIQFCKSTGNEPLICVNAGSGTPEEAAAWVAYCNSDSGTPMGALRAKHGFKEPHQVTYWEIGNEIWGEWQVGHCTAEEFAERCNQFARAMRESDPTIKLMVCGHLLPEWNRILVERICEPFDYLTVHIYHGHGHFPISKATPSVDRYRIMTAFPEVTRKILSDIQEVLQKSDRHTDVKVAITEYNTMYYNNLVRTGLPNELTLEAAVANAGNFNEFLRWAGFAEIGSFSDLVNGWLGGLIRVGDFYADQHRGKVSGWGGGSQVVYGSPTYHVMRMYANSPLTYVVEHKLDCDTYDLPMQSLLLEIDRFELPELDVVCGLNEEGNQVTAFVVNRALESVELKVNLENCRVQRELLVWEVTGEHYETLNDSQHPTRIQLTSEKYSIGDNTCTIKLKASSVYRLDYKFLRE
jgi:alpha-N-arabinofuranosidase